MIYFKHFIIIIILSIMFFTPAYAGLLKDTTDLNPYSEKSQTSEFHKSAGFGTETIGGVITTVIKALLSLLGIIFIVLIIMAGFHWMTARGEEEKIKKAQDTIRAAIIGLIIIVAAYVITHFVFTRLNTSPQKNFSPQEEPLQGDFPPQGDSLPT